MRLVRLTAILAAAFVAAWSAGPLVARPQGKGPVAPAFEVDPFWPKPLPNHWVLGSTIGVSVDSRDHVWIVHRPGSVDENFKGADLKPKVGQCCVAAPQVLELDPDGNVVGSWGGPGQGYEWPDSNHG